MGGAAVCPVRHGARAAASLRLSYCAAPSLRDLSGRLLRRRRQSLVGFHSARSLLRHARGVALVRGDARACRRLSSRGALDRAGILGLYRRAAQYMVFAAASRRMVYRRSGPGAAARPPRQRVSAVLPGARNAHGAAAFRRSAGHLLALAVFVHRADRHCALHCFRAAARMAHEPEKSRLRPAAAAHGALSCLALRRGVPAVDVCRQSLRRGGAPCRALLP